MLLFKDSKEGGTHLPVRYVVAVASAWASEMGTYPFDLAKTRLQIQSEVAATKVGAKVENLGLVKTLGSIVKNEGLIKLWSGLLPMCQRHAVYSGCRLLLYEEFRETFKDKNNQLSLAYSSLCGLLAGSLAQFVATPADLVKVQMQAEGRRIRMGFEPRFANTSQVYALIYSQGGLLGFWRGALPNMQRAALVNIGDLAAYDYTKQYLMREFGMKDNLLLHGIAAAAAGLLATVLGNPVDVLKTRLMNQPVGKDGKGLVYRGMIDCLQQSVKNEGLMCLYKGFIPLWVRMGPWAMINWVVFENIMLAIGHKTF